MIRYFCDNCKKEYKQSALISGALTFKGVHILGFSWCKSCCQIKFKCKDEKELNEILGFNRYNIPEQIEELVMEMLDIALDNRL